MGLISVIIVNYNTKDFLDKCLSNLLNQNLGLEIVVVDNGSKDGSVQMVREKYRNDVDLIESENKGLAHGYNIGLGKAAGEYILFLGTDAYPTKETIVGIAEYFDRNPEVGVGTCKLVLRNGEVDMDAHRGFPTPWAALAHFSKLNRIFPKSKMFNQYFLGWKDMSKPHEIDMCISHFMFVRKKVFDDIGFWDEDFFLYGEDVDLCYRAKQKGWKVMYLPQWECVHYKGVTIGIRKESKDISKASRETQKRIKNETTRAMELFYLKHYKSKYPTFVTGAVLLGVKTLNKIRNLT